MFPVETVKKRKIREMTLTTEKKQKERREVYAGRISHWLLQTICELGDGRLEAGGERLEHSKARIAFTSLDLGKVAPVHR